MATRVLSWGYSNWGMKLATLLSNAEVKNKWSDTSSLLYAFMVWTGTIVPFIVEKNSYMKERGDRFLVVGGC